jgi:hypothetical protein
MPQDRFARISSLRARRFNRNAARLGAELVFAF